MDILEYIFSGFIHVATCATLLVSLILCAVRLRLIFNPHPPQLYSQACKLAFLDRMIHPRYKDLGRSLFVLYSHLFILLRCYLYFTSVLL